MGYKSPFLILRNTIICKMCVEKIGGLMMNKIKLEFEITSYNLSDENNNLPSEIKLTYVDEFDGNFNFLDIINDIANDFHIKSSSKTNYTYNLDNIYEILWSEYFDEEFISNMMKNIDKNNYSKLDVTLKELDNQFHLHDKKIPLVIDSEDEQISGIRFFFHTKDDESEKTPHIHCRYSGVERKINLNTLEFIHEPFKSINKSRLAIRIVTKYQKSLINYWDKILAEGENVEFEVIL